MNGQQIVMAVSEEKKQKHIKQEFICASNKKSISHFENNRKKSNTAFKKEELMPDIAEVMQFNRNKVMNMSHN